MVRGSDEPLAGRWFLREERVASCSVCAASEPLSLIVSRVTRAVADQGKDTNAATARSAARLPSTQMSTGPVV